MPVHTTISQLMFRVPEDLHERLESEAHANARSLNAEVIARLHASFTRGGDTPCTDKAMADRMHRMEELVQESTTSSDA